MTKTYVVLFCSLLTLLSMEAAEADWAEVYIATLCDSQAGIFQLTSFPIDNDQIGNLNKKSIQNKSQARASCQLAAKTSVEYDETINPSLRIAYDGIPLYRGPNLFNMLIVNAPKTASPTGKGGTMQFCITEVAEFTPTQKARGCCFVVGFPEVTESHMLESAEITKIRREKCLGYEIGDASNS